MKPRLIVAIIVFCLFLGACQSQTNPEATQLANANEAYPVNTQTIYSPGYPEPSVKIEQTAFEALPIAEKEATRWNPDAKLYGIPATYMMEINLGYPGIGSGWFFMFKVENQPLEYYVMVENGEVKGTTEAQPIIVGERQFEYLPLPNANQMINSDKLIEIYQANGGEQYLADHPDAVLNPQLYFISGSDYPVWSIYDVKNSAGKSLFDVNALTGELITP